MIKHFFIFFFLFTFLACKTSKSSSQTISLKNEVTTIHPVDVSIEASSLYANSITKEDLKKLLYKVASDEFEGRMTGEKGQKIAAEYIANYYKARGIKSAQDTTYFQPIPKDYFRGRAKADSENVIAFIKGSEKPNEYIIISAHYDHHGLRGDEVMNGADDDGSGTVAVLEIAEAFKKAVENGVGPKRSIVFLHVTGEEIGLFGSKYYTEHPIFSLDATVANLNIDMVGRFDKAHKENPEFVYLIGANKISQELHDISEKVNKETVNLALDYTYNDENDPNRFYYRSDHYNFAKNGIPIIFYFNGVHEDYHKVTDTPDKIRYDLLQKRTQLVFYTAWELANRENRLKID